MAEPIADPTDAEILAAKYANWTWGARRLVQVVRPGISDNDEIVRLASLIGRRLRKHGINSTRIPRPGEPPTEADATDSPTDDEPPAPRTRKQKLEADIAKTRRAVDQMISDQRWTSFPRSMKLIQEMESEYDALLKAEALVSVLDVDDARVLALLKRIPRRLRELSLATD